MLFEVLDKIRDIPTERLVDALSKIHHARRPSPLRIVIDEPGERGEPDEPSVPVSPAPPTAQAHDDLLGHAQLLADYGLRVQRFLDHHGPSEAAPLPDTPVQQLVPLRQTPGGAAGSFVVHNARAGAAEVRVAVSPGQEREALCFEPAVFMLGPGERRCVTITRTQTGPAAGFARDVDVHLDGARVLALRIEMLVDGLESATHAETPNAEAVEVALRRPDDELDRILREAQMLLLRHPLAAQALVRAFVAEGRRYGATDEGRRLRETIADSELIRRGRVLWEVGTLNLLEEQAPSTLPGRLLDAFIEQTAADDLEGDLIRLFGYGASDGHPTDPATD